MLVEKLCRSPEAFRKQTPEAMATHFRSVTRKSGDRPPRMFARRFADRRFNSEPVAHRGDLAKRDAGLCHAEWTGIHADKNNALRALTVPLQIFFVRRPCVL